MVYSVSSSRCVGGCFPQDNRSQHPITRSSLIQITDVQVSSLSVLFRPSRGNVRGLVDHLVHFEVSVNVFKLSRGTTVAEP